jgi:alpha-D-ribose 1-methylphosphonate 5-triphosphate diphosphatase PhnM
LKPHENEPPTPLAALRIAIAQDDLELARRTDLSSATPAQLVNLVDRLRGALSDMLRLHNERDDTSNH